MTKPPRLKCLLFGFLRSSPKNASCTHCTPKPECRLRRANDEAPYRSERKSAHAERIARTGQITRRSTRMFASGVRTRTSHSQAA